MHNNTLFQSRRGLIDRGTARPKPGLRALALLAGTLNGAPPREVIRASVNAYLSKLPK